MVLDEVFRYTEAVKNYYQIAMSVGFQFGDTAGTMNIWRDFLHDLRHRGG